MEKAKARKHPDGSYSTGLGEGDLAEKTKAMNDIVVDSAVWNDPKADPLAFVFKDTLEDLGRNLSVKILRFVMKYEWRGEGGMLQTASSASDVVLTARNRNRLFRIIVDPAYRSADGPSMNLKVTPII